MNQMNESNEKNGIPLKLAISKIYLSSYFHVEIFRLCLAPVATLSPSVLYIFEPTKTPKT